MDIQRVSDNQVHDAKGLLKISIVENIDELNEYEKQQEKISLEKAYEGYKRSGVPSKFFESSLDTFNAETEEDSKIKKIVTEYAENPANRVLILYGNHGRGKTHLGCGITRKCGGAYVTSSKLCIEWEAAVSYHAKRTRMEILDHYSKIEMLVIDECGKYALNMDLEKFLLSSIVCERYENNLPTVLITNEQKEVIVKYLGKTAYDRLREVCTTVSFEGESRR